MEKTCIIACETLKNELTSAMNETGIQYPIYWIESGLHNIVAKLKSRIQDNIDKAENDGYRRILFAMGFCGNAMEGIHTREASLVIPRIGDCISLLLGSEKKRRDIESGSGTYFMTKGWMDGERNIWKEYLYCLDKYGEARGKKIFSILLGHYSQLGILDTGAYELAPVLQEAERIAGCLKMSCCVYPASYSYLMELLEGPWENEKFLLVNRGSSIEMKDLVLN